MEEMFWYLKPNEAPKTDLILNRLSESGICLLTGETNDVVAVPVDLQVANMLPTNMACLAKSVTEDMYYTFEYNVTCYNGITVTFSSSECFIDYNKKLIEAFAQEIPNPKQYNFAEVYEFLMSKHLKGIDKITYSEANASMDWRQLQKYWFSQVEKIKSRKSKIISPLYGLN